jgi:monoterpene epsilon-lactone hydrolase
MMSDTPSPAPRRSRRRFLVGSAAVAVALALGTAVGLTFGNRPLPLSDAQRATLSDEAAEHLEQMRPLFLPDVLTGVLVDEARLAGEAESFAADERVVEDALIERFGLELEERTISGVPVTVVTPPEIAPERTGQIAINIHGGGFFLGTSRDRVGLLLAHELGMPVYSIEYTLAPEAVYPQPVEESLAIYRELVDQHDPADSIASNDRRDGLVASLRIDVPARFYAGKTPLDDPGPVYATFPADFPPTILTTGTRDLNLSDIARLS